MGFIEEIKKDEQDYAKLAAKHNIGVILSTAIIDPNTLTATVELRSAKQVAEFEASMEALGFVAASAAAEGKTVGYTNVNNGFDESAKGKFRIEAPVITAYLDEKYPPSVTRTRVT